MVEAGKKYKINCPGNKHHGEIHTAHVRLSPFLWVTKEACLGHDRFWEKELIPVEKTPIGEAPIAEDPWRYHTREDILAHEDYLADQAKEFLAQTPIIVNELDSSPSIQVDGTCVQATFNIPLEWLEK